MTCPHAYIDYTLTHTWSAGDRVRALVYVEHGVDETESQVKFCKCECSLNVSVCVLFDVSFHAVVAVVDVFVLVVYVVMALWLFGPFVCVPWLSVYVCVIEKARLEPENVIHFQPYSHAVNNKFAHFRSNKWKTHQKNSKNIGVFIKNDKYPWKNRLFTWKLSYFRMIICSNADDNFRVVALSRSEYDSHWFEWVWTETTWCVRMHVFVCHAFAVVVVVGIFSFV